MTPPEVKTTPVSREYRIWDKLKHFKRTENWGDPSKIDHELLKRLDQWREYLGKRVVITYGTHGTHSKKSQHYLGRAVDVVVPEWDRPLLELYLSAERFGFRGIGLYKHWKYEDKEVGGLHLDTRIYEDDPEHLNHARWLGVMLPDREDPKIIKQQYAQFTLKNLKIFGFI